MRKKARPVVSKGLESFKIDSSILVCEEDVDAEERPGSSSSRSQLTMKGLAAGRRVEG